ncbi:PBS lyase HEAT domain protein repeat-containing protein (plasmid) [Rippkaea orientalis PCC 8801]|uniref:PBS lyase HEAT domain protein repeat-containing protein n=1 Tax=Rippkaea orientalis (strain PCC 8801 / RF-1) TaxID=41431 RepID=B7K6K2_RIPO1|nr:HEAT repeat domain-containing protein [Rippkaea orientalis]ACK68424.1 PBS lyase HEAT domain protein repeat-containing protein [Rippkaea orientalis PCC 8801]
MTTDSLFNRLKHPNPHLRDSAMFEIAESRDENTIPRLISILDEEDTTYRRAAVKTLGVIGVDAVPSVVESLLHSENVTVRGSAAKVLAQIAVNYPNLPFPEAGLQGLKAAINDPNPVVYIASIMALGQMGTAAYEILLESLKTTDNVAVQVAIVNALASIGEPKCAEVLTTLANNELVDSYVRQSATSALSRLDLVINFNTSSPERRV